MAGRNRKKRKISTASNWRCCSLAKHGNWDALRRHDISEDEAKFVDTTGSTALHWACRKQAPEHVILSLLAASKDAALLTDHASFTPLHHAVSNGASAEVIGHLLQASPAAALVQNRFGCTALHLATSSLKESSVDIVAALIALGGPAASCVIGDHKGETPLHCAISNAFPDDVILLLLGADPSAAAISSKKRGCLPLHRACIKGSSRRVVEALVDATCRGMKEASSLEDKNGYTPLHYATIHAQDDVILLLIDKFPRMASSKTKDTGETALHMAMFAQGTYVKAEGTYYVELNDRDHTELKPRKTLHNRCPLYKPYKMRGDTRSAKVLQKLVQANPDAVLDGDTKGRTLLNDFFLKRYEIECNYLLEKHSERRGYSLKHWKSFTTLMDLAEVFFNAAYECEHGLPPPSKCAWVHDAVTSRRYRSCWVQLFFLCRSEDIIAGEDAYGNNLLHSGGGAWDVKTSSYVIGSVLKVQPSLVGIPNDLGRLPLMVRVDSIKIYDVDVKALIDAEPRAISSRDPASNLYPFMLAAASSGAKDDMADQISLVYELLMRNPSLVDVSRCVSSCSDQLVTKAMPYTHDHLTDVTSASHPLAEADDGVIIPTCSGDGLAHAIDFVDYFDPYTRLHSQEQIFADRNRMAAYHSAIMENASVFKGKVVMDVGAGSGILAVWAAQAGAKRVYAVECTDMANRAKQMIDANGVADVVTVIQGAVEQIRLPPEDAGILLPEDGGAATQTVDIIVSDWMGPFLLGGSMLESLVRARDKFLKSRTGLMLPSQTTMYIAPVKDEENRKMSSQNYSADMGNWSETAKEAKAVYGVDMSVLESDFEREQKEHHRLSSKRVELPPEAVLAEAKIVKVLDMATCTIADTKGLRVGAPQSNFNFEMRSDDVAGPISGFAGWFTADFASRTDAVGVNAPKIANPAFLSTGPEVGHTRWGQQVFHLLSPIRLLEGEDTILQGSLEMARSRESARMYKCRIRYTSSRHRNNKSKDGRLIMNGRVVDLVYRIS